MAGSGKLSPTQRMRKTHHIQTTHPMYRIMEIQGPKVVFARDYIRARVAALTDAHGNPLVVSYQMDELVVCLMAALAHLDEAVGICRDQGVSTKIDFTAGRVD